MINDANEYATSINIGIAELADLLGVSKSSLRYYEQEGIIAPERDEGSGYRRYSVHSLAELTDVILYRSFGIPVKDVKRLLESPVEDTEHALDAAEDDLFDKIEEAQRTLRLISQRRRKIRAYHEALEAGPHLVARPDMDELYSFSLESKEHLAQYMNAPQEARFSVFFPKAGDQAHGYLPCSAIPINDADSELIWKRDRRSTTQWLECLLETGYDLPDTNNFDELCACLRDLGHEPGCAFGEYLTFGADADGSRRDYYLCWIEAL